MASRKFMASRYGDLYMETPSWDEFLAWMHKNVANLDRFIFYTSDAEPACSDPSCDCTADYGFTQAEQDEIEETFGILV